MKVILKCAGWYALQVDEVVDGLEVIVHKGIFTGRPRNRLIFVAPVIGAILFQSEVEYFGFVEFPIAKAFAFFRWWAEQLGARQFAEELLKAPLHTPHP